MILGIPRETKDGERRVALVPEAVATLAAAGHAVKIETGAGQGSGFTDAAYAAAGASVVPSASAAFDADLIVKVKEIQTGEWTHLRPGTMLFSFLHLGGHRVMAEELLARRMTGLAFETVTDDAQRLAILAPMSTIAGRLAVLSGAHLLTAPAGGRGVVIADARVIVVGAGSAGAAAAETALALGATVTVISRAGDRFAALAHALGSKARCIAMSEAALHEAVRGADLVIGAVNVPGAPTPKLLDCAAVRSMGEGAVLVEVCIDGGGIAETARATHHSQPTYVAEGVTHYAVANMPAAVPRSASLALSAAVLPRVRALVDHGLTQALREDDGLAAGLHIHGGQVTHPAIAHALGRKHVDLDALLFCCGQ